MKSYILPQTHNRRSVLEASRYSYYTQELNELQSYQITALCLNEMKLE